VFCSEAPLGPGGPGAAGPVTAVKTCTAPITGLVVPCLLTITGVFDDESYTVAITRPTGADVITTFMPGTGGSCTPTVMPTGPTAAQVTAGGCSAGGGTLLLEETVTLPAAFTGQSVTICQTVTGARGPDAPVCAMPVTLPTPTPTASPTAAPRRTPAPTPTPLQADPHALPNVGRDIPVCLPQRDAAGRVIGYQLQWVPESVVRFAEANPAAAGGLQGVQRAVQGPAGPTCPPP
jgi:hypothetical protein